MTRITILILFLFSLQHSSFTQEILDTVPHLNLNQIRVSGTTQKKQEYSPLLIELKSFSDLQSIPKLNIGEALSSIPGVYAATSGPAVFKPVVRGMQGNRVVTVWNGLRMEGQQWGVDHGLGLTDVGLGSVEIIKGPASFIYGSDALGGVIYFRDEDSPAKGNFKLNFGEKYNSNTQGVVQQVFYAQSSKKLSWHIGGQYGNHADIKLPNGNYFYNSRFSEIGVKGGLSFSSKKGIHRFKGAFYQYKVGIPEHESDTLTNGTEFQTQIQERAYIVPSQLQNNLFIFSDNIWYFSKSEFQVILGQTTNRLSEFEEDQIVPSMDLNLSNSLIQGKWIFKLSEKVSFVSGIQSMFQKNWNSVSASEFLIPNGKTKDIGVYSMVDLSLKNWFIQFGGRVDQRKLHSNDQNFQPSEFTKSYNSATYSLNALYKLHKNQFRFSASSGYRAPHFAELLSNGVHHGSLRYEIGSTNLQPEYANQFEASAKINAEHTSVLVNPFYQSYRHYIFLNPLDSAVDGLPVFRFEQLSKVQFMGIDISLHHHPHFAHGLHTETNFSFIQPIGNFETALIPQPRLTEIMQYEFASNKKLFLKSISLEATWCGSQYQVASFETPTSSYYTIDASVELIYSKKQNLSCSFGVRNITNQSYIDHLSRLKNIGIPMPGRSFLVSLKFELQKNKLR